MANANEAGLIQQAATVQQQYISLTYFGKMLQQQLQALKRGAGRDNCYDCFAIKQKVHESGPFGLLCAGDRSRTYMP